MEKEISKLQSKREEQAKKLRTLQERMNQKEYKTKVPQNVQEQDRTKVCTMQSCKTLTYFPKLHVWRPIFCGLCLEV